MRSLHSHEKEWDGRQTLRPTRLFTRGRWRRLATQCGGIHTLGGADPTEGAYMSDNEMRDRLSKVFEQVFGHRGVLRDDLKAGDLEGWDSATHVTLVLATEREFKIKFKGADIANLANVGDLVKQVAAKLQ